MIPILRLLRAAAGSDRDLLDRYVRNRDEEAFEALVRRHGDRLDDSHRLAHHHLHHSSPPPPATTTTSTTKTPTATPTTARHVSQATRRANEERL